MTRFSDLLAEPVRNGVYKPKEFHGRGHKIVNMGELFTYPRLRDVEMRRIELTEDEARRSTLRAGDLLFARRSLVAEGAGKCAIVMEAAASGTTFESSLIRARPDPAKADPLFLYYWFCSPDGRFAMSTILRQVAVSGITSTDLAALDVHAPPLPVQRAVAELLGALDDKIELNRRTNETLEAMARALFQSWFVDFDPVRAKMEGRKPEGMDEETARLFPSRLEEVDGLAVPAGWNRMPVGEVADIVGGATPSTAVERYWGGAHAWATPKDLSQKNRPLLIATDRQISTDGLNTISSGSLAPGTVLLSSRAPVGYLAIATVPVAINQGFIAIRCSKGFPTHYAYFCMDHHMPEILSKASGTTFPEVSKRAFRPMEVLVPPTSILGAFEFHAAHLFERMRLLTVESGAVAALRDTLLPKLLSGELRIPDAERAVSAAL